MTRRYRCYGRRRRRRDLRAAAAAAATAAVLVVLTHSGAGAARARPASATPAPAGTAAARRAAADVIAYARAQLGKPYLYGGTGPDAFDCSGLAQAAYAAAGITLQRTSQEQWAQGPQIPASQVRPGDLVFFAGGDGTPASPGHVGIVVDPAAHSMIDAYGPDSAPISYDTYGLATSRSGLDNPVGFTDPARL